MSTPHEKICLFCKHFYISPGSRGYSEQTPGYSMTMGCEKNHWSFDTEETSEDQYREMMATATSCPDLVFIETPKPD